MPIVRSEDSGYQRRMEEHEFYAIETFGSTGRGYVLEVHTLGWVLMSICVCVYV